MQKRTAGSQECNFRIHPPLESAESGETKERKQGGAARKLEEKETQHGLGPASFIRYHLKIKVMNYSLLSSP